jgi:hypothetical protein
MVTPHDTPEATDARAALADALIGVCNEHEWSIYATNNGGAVWVDRRWFAGALYAALSPDWTLMPRVATADWTGSTRKGVDVPAEENMDAEIARLRAELEGILGEAEEVTIYQHGRPWGSLDAIVVRCRRALASTPSEP